MEREVTDLVREFASRFDRAAMDGPTPEPPAGLRLELSCSAPGTARVILPPSDDDIDVHLGEATWIELLKRGRSKVERVQEVRRILEAVVNGLYEESVWRFHGSTVWSKAVLYANDGKPFLKAGGGWWLALPRLDPRARRARIRYQPYS